MSESASPIKDYIRSAVVLCVICAIISGALAVTYGATKNIIAEGETRKADEARAEVLRQADSFEKLEYHQDNRNSNGNNSNNNGNNSNSNGNNSNNNGNETTPDEGKAIYPLVTDIYEGKTSDGISAGYVVSVTSKGYAGDIGVMVGIDANMVISGVRIVSHGETPGLGANAATPGFYSQYDGMSANVDSPLKTVRGKSANKQPGTSSNEQSGTSSGTSSSEQNGTSSGTSSGGTSNEQSGTSLVLNEISAISGATITSEAVTSAVNAAVSAVTSLQR